MELDDFLEFLSRYETKPRRGGYSHATLAKYIAKAYDVCSREPVYVRELARIWRSERGKGSYTFLASYALRFLHKHYYLECEDVDVKWSEGSMKAETGRMWSQYRIYYRLSKDVKKYDVRFKVRVVKRVSDIGLSVAQRVEDILYEVCKDLFGSGFSATSFSSPFPDIVIPKYERVIEISTRSENPIGLAYIKSKMRAYPDYDVLIIAPSFTKDAWKDKPRYVDLVQYPDSGFIFDYMRADKIFFEWCHRDVSVIPYSTYKSGLEKIIRDRLGI